MPRQTTHLPQAIKCKERVQPQVKSLSSCGFLRFYQAMSLLLGLKRLHGFLEVTAAQ
ncbi:hypothetical protein Tco_0894746, partial [Tanacetum coccineum]